MADPTPTHPLERVTLTAQLPDEPPEGSVVLAYNEHGQAWERRYSAYPRNRYVWHATGTHYLNDGHDTETRQPLRWEHLIGQFGSVYVVRWGDGKTGASDA